MVCEIVNDARAPQRRLYQPKDVPIALRPPEVDGKDEGELRGHTKGDGCTCLVGSQLWWRGGL